MASRFLVLAAVALAIPFACLGHAASGPDDLPIARATAHSFDFWQESDPVNFQSRSADATCADLNGDGLPELIRLGIAYANPYGGTLGITLGGAYGPQGAELHLQALPSPRSVRALDLNGDGLVDLIAAHLVPVPGSPNQFTRTATLFLQTGAPGIGGIQFRTPAPSVDLAPGGEIVLLVDVDGDQTQDLVSVGTAHNLYYQKGLGLAGAAPAVPSFAAAAVNVSQLAAQTAGLPAGSSFSFGFANELVSGDFDGDGSTDLAVAAGSAIGGGVHLYYQRPAGWVYQGFVTPNSSGTGSESITSLAAGDFDADGFVDLVATSPSLDLTTLLNNGSMPMNPGPAASAGMRAVTSPGIGRSGLQAVGADFNSDGRTDVAFYDVPGQQMAVAYNPGSSANPGVFLDLPAFHGSFDIQGLALRALDAVDVDRDGDLDLVGSFLQSQSTAVLHNERLANARKPLSVVRLRGAPLLGELSHAFVPDALELEQAPNSGLAPNAAADLFTFQASALPGESLRLRVLLRAVGQGAVARLGLFDTVANRLRWVHALPLGPNAQATDLIVPDAARFVSSSQRVRLVLLTQGSSAPFVTAIDQLSAEVIP